MTTKWQRFEQLVAALHRVEMKGAVVKWNDIINGRQFDVTVRFENGPYKYLTVVECKDVATSVPVEQIESLVTKAKYVGADKAVVFSSHGFQSGAIEAAKLYGIPLFSLSQLDDVPDQFLAPDKVEYIQIYDVVLIKPDGSRFALTEEPMRLRYYINETILTYPTRDIILAELIRGYEKKLDGCAVDDVLHQQVRLVPPGRTTFPSMERDEPILVSFVQWKMVNRVGRRLKDRTGIRSGLVCNAIRNKGYTKWEHQIS